MTALVHFRPLHGRDAARNLVDFVHMARDQLSVFGGELDFDSDVWDVTEWLNLKSKGRQRLRVYFTSWREDASGRSLTLHDEFRPFAKAYLRYMQGLRPTKLLAQRLAALRAMESALMELKNSGIPSRLDAAVLNRACQIVGERFSKTTAYRVGQQMNIVARFMSRHGLIDTQFAWRSFLRRPFDNHRVGKEFDERRERKLPSEATINALGRIFQNAETTKDILTAGVAALLCSAPSRISEVLSLPLDCEVEQNLPDGKVAYGLRWWPAKGGDPMVKWIIPSMVPIVKEALKQLRKVTDPARRIAEWYERHPDKIFLPPSLEHLRSQEFLSSEELQGLLGIGPRGHISFCMHHGIPYSGRGRSWRVRFRLVEAHVRSRLPVGFPYVDIDRNLRFSGALFVFRTNELHARRATLPVMLDVLDVNRINSELGGRSSFGFSSVFTRFGLAEMDGRPIRVTTHRFRHLLNTAAHMAGMSNLDIAKWSGRVDIRQNGAYDHMTADQMLSLARHAVGDQSRMIGPYSVEPSNLPITRDQFAQLRMPTGHVTELGVCVHDYTMSPCSRHRDCIHCEDLVCIKGDVERTARVQSMLQATAELLRKAEEAVEQGFAGSRRWYDHHLITVERLAQICSVLADPAVPDGAVLHLKAVDDSRHKVIAVHKPKRLGSDGR